MDELKYKEIISKLKESAKLELDYSKLTFAEKLSILLSKSVLVLVLVSFGLCALFLLIWAFTKWLMMVTGSMWLGVGVSLCVLLLLALLLYGYRKQLIINPITRFITKMLLTPED